MPLDIVYGDSRNRSATDSLAQSLSEALDQGTLYLGYPVLASADEQVEIDGLLVTRDHGLVAFLLAGMPQSSDDWPDLIEAQDRLFGVLESNLGRHEGLRVRRKLAVNVETVTVFPSSIVAPEGAEGHYARIDEVAGIVESLPGVSDEVERALHAALQRVTTIKPAKKRSDVKSATSRGAKMKVIERGIANLDEWQKKAAIETPEGPQRIRGLAGSGKTVVLALKAAYLHSRHPRWRIAMTFASRALYQQIDDLTTRFSFEYSNDKPDPEHLQILHTWGSYSKPGVYSAIAASMGVTPRDFNYAQAIHGRDDAFKGVCRELLDIAERGEFKPIFDVLLIDEAQDLPPEFFQLVYRFTKKRVVWGYDELQRLSEAAMPTTDELFGTGARGESLVILQNRDKEPREDIVLPICYRNTPWALATAHALGFGIYREGGLIQHFDDPLMWGDIGYKLNHGQLASGEYVDLERKGDSYPKYFPQLLDPEDAVLLQSFEDELSHDRWIAQQIKTNLTTDELEHDDILIVLPDAYSSKSRAQRLTRTLKQFDIDSHLVGVGSSVDEVFRKGSVALAHIYRAKGNEAPMVYVIDAQQAAATFNAVTRRNTLFTAITRSRAWVRITGFGDGMDVIRKEVQQVRNADFKLRFNIPTPPELAALRRVNRDRSGTDEASIKRATAGLQTFVDAYEDQKIDFYDLPAPLRTRLAKQLRDELPSDEF